MKMVFKSASQRLAFSLLFAVLILAGSLSAGLARYSGNLVPQTTASPVSAANDAINKANTKLRIAEDLKRAMLTAAREVERMAAFEGADLAVLSDLRKLARAVEEVQRQKFDTAIAESKKELTAAKKGLTDAQTKLQGATEQTDEIKAVTQHVVSEIGKFEDNTPNLDEAKGKLDEALAQTYDSVKGLADESDKRIAPLKRHEANANGTDLLAEVPRNLPALVEAMRFSVGLQSGWNALSVVLKPVVSAHDAKAAPVTKAVSDAKDSVVVVAARLEPWMKTLAAYALTQSTETKTLAAHFKQEPLIYENQALAQIRNVTQVVINLDRLSQVWKAAASELAGANLNGYDGAKTLLAQEEMDKAARQLSLALSTLRDSLAGDWSSFVSERIRLYYFTDIPRLVKTLNDTAFLKGGDETARTRAEDQNQRLQQAESDYREADAEVARYKRRVRAIEAQLKDAENKLNSSEGLLLASKRRVEELVRRGTGQVSAEQLQRARDAQTDRQRERDAVQQRHETLTDEQSGLPAKLREAESRLEEAQKSFEDLASKMLQTAQAESSAFARARDNAPYWYAAPLATSPDPLKRIEISSSTSGDNTIFLRGRRADLDKAKEYIAVLDEPAPQARMTLWKIELSSDASTKGTQKFNEALQEVETALANTRAQIAASLSLLLDCINEEANRFAQTTTTTTTTNPRDARYQIYAKQVLVELGVGTQTNPRSFGIKDPAAATTLNEALLVLLLSSCESRKKILDHFESRLTARLNSVAVACEQPTTKINSFARLLQLMARDVSATCSAGQQQNEYTRQQAEIVYAIRGRVLRRLLPRAAEIQASVDQFRVFESRVTLLTNAESVARDNLEDRLLPLLNILYNEFSILPQDVLTGKIKLAASDGEVLVIERNGKKQSYSFKPSNARIAAVDGMLDGFIKAFEDDLDRQFIQPMLTCLRETLRKKKGIGVGVIQRTSVLATNRLVARVDPRASAELSLGEEQNILQALQQIAQLSLAAQTGNALGILGAFQAQSGEERPPEIYGISTGNAFQVTPIFDPTGQALRFRFDFVGATRVREPDDTRNPRLARIERHTVNTEVQLGNLEIREVSRFEANARLGLPTRYWGGLPILKDIPGVRPVPFIGWFIRRGGKAAVTQQSLIFAQTTMSPTIGDILELLDSSILPDNKN